MSFNKGKTWTYFLTKKKNAQFWFFWELSCGPIIFKIDWNSNNRLSMRSLKNVNIIFYPTLRLPNIRIFVWQYFTSVTSQRLRTTPIKLLLVHKHLPQIITKIIVGDLLPMHEDGTLEAFEEELKNFAKCPALSDLITL